MLLLCLLRLVRTKCAVGKQVNGGASCRIPVELETIIYGNLKKKNHKTKNETNDEKLDGRKL